MASLKSVTRSTKLGPEERAAAIARLKEKELDILVVGGGIVGTGSALDAVTRGLSTGLLEARGTWSSSTSVSCARHSSNAACCSSASPRTS